MQTYGKPDLILASRLKLEAKHRREIKLLRDAILSKQKAMSRVIFQSLDNFERWTVSLFLCGSQQKMSPT